MRQNKTQGTKQHGKELVHSGILQQQISPTTFNQERQMVMKAGPMWGDNNIFTHHSLPVLNNNLTKTLSELVDKTWTQMACKLHGVHHDGHSKLEIRS